eukprot:TRINITY_DN24045_c0_g1_i1.p1 TRINITY_DN24045_c0_g1~~TRINITY_DN24045_c0_g1_i1.p1  ORF type:complete len:1296 (-),score=313.27 TRINITY_DN24045_c0_g1_i1:36-3923(-)
MLEATYISSLLLKNQKQKPGSLAKPTKETTHKATPKAPQIRKDEEPAKKLNEIRVFISSTFRDMGPEREYLVKKVFPEISALYESKGLRFTYVDMRWGISEEQSETGKTISICLNEIDASRPFFIGILGDRYGWVPKQDDPAWATVVEEYPWVSQHKGSKSITHLEILHGVLNQPEKYSKNSLFFFRNNIGEEPKEMRNLKDHISQVKTPHYYTKLEEIGLVILEHFRKYLTDNFTDSTLNSSIFSTELTSQKILIEKCVNNFCGRESELQHIYDYTHTIQNNQFPLVVTGEPGIGKTAILSTFCDRIWKENRKDLLLVPQFVGASNNTHYVQIQKFIMESVLEYFNLKDLYTVPTDEDKIISEFPNYLKIASDHGKLVLVLDGIENLYHQGSAFSWLPYSFPSNVYVVISTNSQDIPDKWSQFHINELPIDTANHIIDMRLKKYSKTFSSEQKSLVLKSHFVKNPLYLQTFLSEIIRYGSFENLTSYIQSLVSLSLPDLFLEILKNSEKDFHIRKNMQFVHAAFILINLSKGGFSESELLGLLKISRVSLSQFIHYFKDFFLNRGGLLDIVQKQFSDILNDKYTEQIKKKESHVYIYQYFHNSTTITENRKLEEIPWQAFQAEDVDFLVRYLGNAQVFSKIAKKQPFDLSRYWNFILKNSKGDEFIKALYKNFDNITKDHLCDENILRTLLTIGNFFKDVGSYTFADKFYNKAEILANKDSDIFVEIIQEVAVNLYKEAKYSLSEYYFKILQDRIGSIKPTQAAAIDNQLGYIYGKTGQYHKALDTYSSALMKIRNKNTVLTGKIYHNIGWIHFKLSDYPKASYYFQEALEILRKNSGVLDPQYLTVISDINEINYKLGKYETAEQLYMETKREMKLYFVKNHPRMGHLYDKIGYLYGKLNLFTKATKSYERAIKIWENSVGTEHPNYATTLHHLGWIKFKLGQFPDALNDYNTSLQVKTKIYGDHHPEIAEIIHDIGELNYKTGNYEQSKQYYENALQLKRTVLGPNHPSLAWTYNNMGYLYGKISEYKLAEEQFLRALDIWKKNPGTSHPNYGLVMHNLGWIYMKLENYKEARKFYETALSVRRTVIGPEAAETIETLNDMGELSLRMKDYPSAIKLYFNCLRIREKVLGLEHASVGWSHNNIGMLLLEQGNFIESKKHLEKCKEIWTKTYGEDSHPNCGLIRHNIAKVLKALKSPDVEQEFKEALRIREKTLGLEAADIADTLLELGKLYVDRENFAEAEKVLERAVSIRKKKFGENHPLVWEVHQVQIYDISRKKFGEIDLEKIFAVPKT